MTPLCGCSPRGNRLMVVVPHGPTSTFPARLRSNRVVAPFVLDGAVNSKGAPRLHRAFPRTHLGGGGIVLADFLPSHKVTGVREAIEARGASFCAARQVFFEESWPANEADHRPLGG